MNENSTFPEQPSLLKTSYERLLSEWPTALQLPVALLGFLGTVISSQAAMRQLRSIEQLQWTPASPLIPLALAILVFALATLAVRDSSWKKISTTSLKLFNSSMASYLGSAAGFSAVQFYHYARLGISVPVLQYAVVAFVLFFAVAFHAGCCLFTVLAQTCREDPERSKSFKDDYPALATYGPILAILAICLVPVFLMADLGDMAEAPHYNRCENEDNRAR